jgi:hypothetical protein
MCKLALQGQYCTAMSDSTRHPFSLNFCTLVLSLAKQAEHLDLGLVHPVAHVL